MEPLKLQNPISAGRITAISFFLCLLFFNSSFAKAQIVKNYHFMDSEALWSLNSNTFDTLSKPWYTKTRGKIWQMREQFYTRHDVLNQVVADKDGNLWGRTYNTIYRFNNGKWTVFNDTLQQLYSDFKFDTHGNILILFTNGIYFKTNNEWKSHLATNLVDATFDNDSNLWFITKKNLYYVLDNTVKEFSLPNMSEKEIFEDISFANSQLVISVDLNNGFGKNKLFTFQQGNWTKIIDSLFYSDKIIDNTGAIWFLGDSAVTFKDNIVKRSALPDKYLRSRKIDQIYISGDTIFTSYGFLTLVSVNGKTDVLSSRTYPVREIYSSTQTENGIKWFGTEKGTLLKFDGNNFEYFSLPGQFQNSLVSRWIHSMAYSEKSKKLYLVTISNNLLAFDGIQWEKFDSTHGFYGFIQNIVYDKFHECLWASTDKGLCRINENSSNPVFEYFTQEDGLLATNIKRIYVATTGKIWCSTDSGISVWSYPEKTAVSLTDSISKSFIKFFAQDVDGNIYASVEAFFNFHGIAKFDGEKWKILHDIIPTRNGWTSSPDRFEFDKNNKIIATTGADNIAIYNPKHNWSILTSDDGLVPAYSREIIKGDSSFWITTGLGISEIQTNYYFNFTDSVMINSSNNLSVDLNFKTNCNWTAFDTSSWIEATKTETGISVLCLINPLAKMRHDKIRIHVNGAGVFYLKIYQKAAEIMQYLVPEEISFLANDPIIKKVVINSNSDWEITSIPKWLHVDKLSGSLSSVIAVSAENNTGSTRNASITINANGFTSQLNVIQEGETFISNEFNKKLKIYPLPITDKLFIESDEYIKKVRLTTINGQLITLDKNISTKAEINTSQLKKGIYLLEIQLLNGSVLQNKISK